MEKAYIFFSDGFEEIEGLTVVDILRRAGIEICMVSMNGTNTVTGSHEITVSTDTTFEKEDFRDGTWFILPGGMPGTKHLEEHEGLRSLLIRKNAESCNLAAICAAPRVLGGLGLLKGKQAVCYPGNESLLEGAEVLEEPVVVSGNITTSRGMGTAIPFALSLVGQICDRETAEKLGKTIIYS